MSVAAPPLSNAKITDRPLHVPVMRDEVLRATAPAPGGLVVDATFGAGGYTRAFLERGCRVVAIDRDPQAIRIAVALKPTHPDRLVVVKACFSQLVEALALAAPALDATNFDGSLPKVDAVVFDIGVSSMQIDTAARGFSFRRDGPLDMRMADGGPTAAELVNTLDRATLTRIIGLLGEEKRAAAVARAIVAERERQPFARTAHLARVVERAIGASRKPSAKQPGAVQIHPATRTFQALRIYVNSELDELVDGLGAAEVVLNPGGRLAVVTFHSLEDRIVKRFLAERSQTARGSRHMPEIAAPPPTFALVRRKAQTPGMADLAANPRARSAKLRVACRTSAPARPVDGRALGLPRLDRVLSPERLSHVALA